MASALTLKILIHVEWIFLGGISYGFSFIPLHVNIWVSQHHDWKDHLFSIEYSWHAYQILFLSLFLGSWFCSIGLDVCFYGSPILFEAFNCSIPWNWERCCLLLSCFSGFLCLFGVSCGLCFIDYAKASDCVDHNKLWKILQEIGIPDHLTCLLRNLCAGLQATVRTGHGTTDWFQIGIWVRQGYILSPCLFNLYAEYIMRNAGLEEAQAGIKIAGRNINNLRYADDTTLMAESEEELKSLLMKVKEESEKVGLKLNIPETKIMTSSPISWVQSLSRVQLFATPWIPARQASLSITNSQGLPKPMSIELVMPSSHLVLCHLLLLMSTRLLSTCLLLHSAPNPSQH